MNPSFDFIGLVVPWDMRSEVASAASLKGSSLDSFVEDLNKSMPGLYPDFFSSEIGYIIPNPDYLKLLAERAAYAHVLVSVVLEPRPSNSKLGQTKVTSTVCIRPRELADELSAVSTGLLTTHGQSSPTTYGAPTHVGHHALDAYVQRHLVPTLRRLDSKL